MGHTAKSNEVHCDVLDELEAAITRKNQLVRVFLEDGSHRMGKPTDLVTKNHEDFLHLENHQPIKVSLIVKVEKA